MLFLSAHVLDICRTRARSIISSSRRSIDKLITIISEYISTRKRTAGKFPKPNYNKIYVTLRRGNLLLIEFVWGEKKGGGRHFLSCAVSLRDEKIRLWIQKLKRNAEIPKNDGRTMQTLRLNYWRWRSSVTYGNYIFQIETRQTKKKRRSIRHARYKTSKKKNKKRKTHQQTTLTA